MRNGFVKRIGHVFFLLMLMGFDQLMAQGVAGYYQHPDIHKNTIVFVAEGDIWKVSVAGGQAQRLTTHEEEERYPSISADGKTIAYTATYEGPPEVYTMPLDGGLPTRWTYSEGSQVVGWTPAGKIIYSAGEFSKLPTSQLVTLDLNTKQKSIVPLSSAYHGMQNEDGAWFFVPMPDYNENVKRYQGGTARQIWTFDGENEAVRLTTGYPGESFNPTWYQGRVYFITDRDGIQNIWSMDAQGQDLQQITQHTEFDVRSANLDNGKIVYQHAADLWLLDIASGDYDKMDIRLASDLEHLQETWVKNPSKYITSVHPDPTGEKVVVTARGRVFVVPIGPGRTISHTEQGDVVRYRDAVFSPDGKNIISLSDESGELEFVQFPAAGPGKVKAMGNWDIGHFYREFFPIIHKKGLIIDARFNAGGYTDAIILEKLLRQPFMYLKDRTGEPRWRMDHSFRGHIVVLANERTGSSGESFLIGIKQLGLGTIIGKRTWGGQIWLNERNKLTDKGVMTAPMHGVYGPEGKWLVEGRGFVPDIEVENLPHETFQGEDAQLDAAIEHLLEKIAKDPIEVPPAPAYPDKSFKNNRKQ